MNNEEIIDSLKRVHAADFLYGEFLDKLQFIKLKYIKDGDQDKAKQIWIYQRIVEIHQRHRESFSLLQRKMYYAAWCELERVEVSINNLRRHFSYNKQEYYLWHIEKSTKNIQSLFPYRVFFSPEIKQQTKCSVCGKQRTPRNPCGHKVGEIYDGEMCVREVTHFEVIAQALVNNPTHKYSVPFLSDEMGNTIDQYDYCAVDFFLGHVCDPYVPWDLRGLIKEITAEQFRDTGHNDQCPCGSGKKLKKCCLKKVGTKYLHYDLYIRTERCCCHKSSP